MRAHLPIGLALTFGLASCHAPLAIGPATGKASVAPTPHQAATMAPLAPGAPAALLRPLGGQAVTLRGTVKVDQDYVARRGGGNLVGNAGGTLALLGGGKLVGNAGGTLVGNAGGTLITNDGGGLITNDGGSLIGNDGAGLVADKAGRIVAAKGGNVIVPSALVGVDGSALIGNEGTALIGNDGASLITNDGGGLITNDGAGLITNDGAGLVAKQRHVLDAAPADAFGQLAPGVGMWLSAVDARTGFTVPLGQDAAGKPVYTIYTDVSGGFSLQVPAEVADHVRLVARAPGMADRRLTMSVFAQKDAAATIDDDQAAVTTFLRATLRGRLFSALTLTGTQASSAAGQLGGLGLDGVAKEIDGLKSAMDARTLDELSNMMADTILTRFDLAKLQLLGAGLELRHPASKGLEGRPLVPELGGVLRRMREAAAAQAKAANATSAMIGFFAAKPYIQAANMGRAAGDRYAIERPADVPDYLVREYLGSGEPAQRDKAQLVFDDLGLELMDRDRVAMATNAVGAAMLQDALNEATSGESLNDRMVKFIRDASAKLQKAKLPVPTPVNAPEPPAPPDFGPPRVVDTVAGVPGNLVLPEPGPAGPAKGAAIGKPLGLALDPSAPLPVLYVSEGNTGAIACLTFDANGVATITTLPGRGPDRIGSMVHDGKGHLYVAAYATNTITQISTLPGDLGKATSIAGSTKGFRDGPGATAQFDGLQGIAIEPGSGDLIVPDLSNARYRRIHLADPSHPVSTYSGTGSSHVVEGPLAPDTGNPPGGTVDAPRHPGAMYGYPCDIAFDAKGGAFLADFGFVRYVADPIGPASRTRLVAGGGAFTDADSFYAAGAVPSTMASDADPRGGLVLVDHNTARVRLVTLDGWVHLIAGGGPSDASSGGYADGPGPSARFNDPEDVAVWKDGTIFISDSGNGLIRRIKP